MNLDDQFALFFPVCVNGQEDMEKLAAEMIDYARKNPFDFAATAKAAQEAEDLTAERVGPMLKIKGFAPELIGAWQKMVTLDNGQTPPYQVTYTEGPMAGVDGTVQQLTIVDYGHESLDSKMVRCFAAFFWNYDNKAEWNTIQKIEDTPPHVACLVRVVNLQPPNPG